MIGDRRGRTLALLLMASAAVPGIALAQTSQGQSQATGVAAELVVTAEKRAESLQNVPMSVTAVSGQKVEELHALNLQDWSGYVPGFSVGSLGAPGEALLTVDGIGPLGAASEVGVYLDDTPVGSSSSFQDGNAFTADLMPYDLTRIEVLRGPQGTLYGASTMGGLVKYVLAQPDPSHFLARIGGDAFGVSHSGDAGGGVRGEANLPIVNDQLALRISGYYEDTPGFIDKDRKSVV